MSKHIDVNELYVTIEAELKQYSKDVAERIKKDVKEVTNQCIAEIRARSPIKSGNYKKGWRKRVEFKNDDALRIRIFNVNAPGLTHLLEFGHTSKNGTGRVYGFVRDYEHIYPAEKRAKEALENKAKVAVRRK